MELGVNEMKDKWEDTIHIHKRGDGRRGGMRDRRGNKLLMGLTQ